MTAKCATRPDLDWFDPSRYEQAAAVCAGCPQAAACLEGAVARGETHGLWAGVPMDAPDADTFLLDGIPEPVAVAVEHSRSAYNAKAHGEGCADCARRNAEWVAEWRAGRVTRAVRFEQTAIDWEVA